MTISFGVESSGSSVVIRAVVMVIVSFLLVVACGDSRAPSEEGGLMLAQVSTGCSGQDKENAEQHAIDAFNYGWSVGHLGVPLEQAELDRLGRDFSNLSPACQKYVTTIGERLQRLVEQRKIDDLLRHGLPW